MQEPEKKIRYRLKIANYLVSAELPVPQLAGTLVPGTPSCSLKYLVFYACIISSDG